MRNNPRLLYFMARTVRGMKNLLVRAIKDNDIDLTFEHYLVLQYVAYYEGITQQEIALNSYRDRSLVLRQVELLIEKGILERYIDENDKRKKRLRLTSEGRKMQEHLQTIKSNVADVILDGITDDEIRVFFSVLERIRINVCENGCEPGLE